MVSSDFFILWLQDANANANAHRIGKQLQLQMQLQMQLKTLADLELLFYAGFIDVKNSS